MTRMTRTGCNSFLLYIQGKGPVMQSVRLIIASMNGGGACGEISAPDLAPVIQMSSTSVCRKMVVAEVGIVRNKINVTLKSCQCEPNLEKPREESSVSSDFNLSLVKICCRVCLIVLLPFLVLTNDVIGRVPYLKLTLRA